MKVILITLFFASHLFAIDMEVGVKNYEQDTSHWIIALGGNYLKHSIELPKYRGTHKSYDEKNQEIYGPSLQIGREFYLGGGLSFVGMFGGFYNQSVVRTNGKASKKVDIELSNVRETYQLEGYDVSAGLQYFFEANQTYIQPYFLYTIGQGSGLHTIDYKFDGIGADPADRYKLSMLETFLYDRQTLGIKFINRRGLFSFFEASNTSIRVSEREIQNSKVIEKGQKKDSLNGTEKLNSTNSIITGSIGFGFLF